MYLRRLLDSHLDEDNRFVGFFFPFMFDGLQPCCEGTSLILRTHPRSVSEAELAGRTAVTLTARATRNVDVLEERKEETQGEIDREREKRKDKECE